LCGSREDAATGLAICACQRGRRVRFTTLAALANELQEAASSKELARVVGCYPRTELVVLDELGYLVRRACVGADPGQFAQPALPGIPLDGIGPTLDGQLSGADRRSAGGADRHRMKFGPADEAADLGRSSDAAGGQGP
jgi:hypothetical protein